MIKSFLSSREAISFRCCVFFPLPVHDFRKGKKKLIAFFIATKKKRGNNKNARKKLLCFFLCSLRLSHRNKYFKAQISQVWLSVWMFMTSFIYFFNFSRSLLRRPQQPTNLDVSFLSPRGKNTFRSRRYNQAGANIYRHLILISPASLDKILFHFFPESLQMIINLVIRSGCCWRAQFRAYTEM